MLFIEVFRLVLVLLGAVAGLEIGHSIDNSSPIPVIAMILGALISYVIGGVLGRLLDREHERALASLAKVPPGELFAGTLTGIGGLLLGLALCLPLLAIHNKALVYPIATTVAWVFGWFAFRVGISKGRQIVAAAGLSRILSPPTEPPPGYAILVDTSAVMDRTLLALGRNGLLIGGIVVPRFVIDQVQAMASGADPSSSRRARRGLEALEALRELHINVHVAENELPEIDDLDARLLEIGSRLGLRVASCSNRLLTMAKRRKQAVVDIRQAVSDLVPDLPPGEQIVIDLEKPGNHPHQAVGYLPDGDMVVVNDASHMIGRENVVIEVQSTKNTPQGMLVFGRLAKQEEPGLLTPLPSEESLEKSDSTNVADKPSPKAHSQP